MIRLTVKQLARASGVSVRTLHHYHGSGLLVPAEVGANGYRYYGPEQALRLQQILFWREFGMSLADIRLLLDGPGSDPVRALQGHRDRLAHEAERTGRLLRTIDRTLAVLTGDRDMKIDELYEGFVPGREAEYRAWLRDRLGTTVEVDATAASPHARLGAALMAALRPIEAALVEAFVRGLAADAPEVAPLLERHRAWVADAWGRECGRAAYGRLADVYEHPDFRARYETLAAGFADWLGAAMRAHARE